MVLTAVTFTLQYEVPLILDQVLALGKKEKEMNYVPFGHHLDLSSLQLSYRALEALSFLYLTFFIKFIT